MPRLQFARLKTILPIVLVTARNVFAQGLRRFAPECGMNVKAAARSRMLQRAKARSYARTKNRRLVIQPPAFVLG